MALGKLWNAFFGKRDEPTAASEVATIRSPESRRPEPAATLSAGSKQRPGSPASAPPLSANDAVGHTANRAAAELPTDRRPGRGHRKSVTKKGAKAAQPNALVAADTVDRVEPRRPEPSSRPASPKRNAWTKLIAGRTIASILDLNIGDGSRAESILEAIVCASAPTPKYVAINRFELEDQSLSVLQFHQRIRRAGGQAVPIPDDLSDGLRHLSHTHGAVDLILLDESVLGDESPEIRRLIDRVSHPATLILRQTTGGRWEAVDAAESINRSSAKAA